MVLNYELYTVFLCRQKELNITMVAAGIVFDNLDTEENGEGLRRATIRIRMSPANLPSKQRIKSKCVCEWVEYFVGEDLWVSW